MSQVKGKGCSAEPCRGGCDCRVQESLSSDQLARRRLLRAGVYAPPLILGAMLLRPQSAQAATMVCNGVTYTISAATTACCPCVNSPNSGACRDAQCLLGNCASCKTNMRFATMADCQAYRNGCGTGCGTCQPQGGGFGCQ